MSSRQSRGNGPGRGEHRYDLWSKPEAPEPKTRGEAAALARTWEEWERAQPGIGYFGGAILGVPWRLDWQRNPHGLIPPDYIWVRCLCGATIVRPPEWRGQLRGRSGGAVVVKPATTVGSRCMVCDAPYIRGRDGAYVASDSFHLSACLCGVRCTRRGPQTGSCEDCGAPYQPVADDQQGYTIDLTDAPEAPGWQKFWANLGLGDWAGVWPTDDIPEG